MGSKTIQSFAALMALLAVRPARADEAPAVRRSAHLEVLSEPSVRCADEEALRDGVAAHLGYDPFHETSSTTLRVRIARGGPGLRAEIELQGVDGATLGRRVLESAGSDCADLGAALGLALAIAIDPLAASARPPVAAAAPPDLVPAAPPPPAPASQLPPVVPAGAAPPPSAAARPAAALRAEPSTGRTLQLDAGLLYQVGAVPAAGFGLDAAVAFAWPTIVGALGARLDFPTSRAVDGGEVDAFRLLLSVVGCRPIGAGSICALVRAGIVRVADIGFFPERHVSHATIDTGLRASYALEIGRRVFLRPWVEATGVLVRPRHERDGQLLWEADPVVVSAGLGLVWSAS